MTLPVGANVLTNENTRAVVAAMRGLRVAAPGGSAGSGASNADVVRAIRSLEKAVKRQKFEITGRQIIAAIDAQNRLDARAGNI